MRLGASGGTGATKARPGSGVHVSVIGFIVLFRYANRAKNIKNHAHINEDPKDAMLREFQKEIDELKKMLEEGEGRHTFNHYGCHVLVQLCRQW